MPGSQESPPREFDLPLAGTAVWAGPDGMGDSSFDDVPEAKTVELPPELGDDPRIALRRTLGMFATGVTIITTREGDQVHGMTANAFMSVSLEPPLVLISVDRRTKMCGLLHEGRNYGVSVLCATPERPVGPVRGPRRRGRRAEPRFDVVHDTPLVERRARALRGRRHPLLLGRRPLAVPRPRRVRALLRGRRRCCSTAAATSGSARPPPAEARYIRGRFFSGS